MSRDKAGMPKGYDWDEARGYGVMKTNWGDVLWCPLCGTIRLETLPERHIGNCPRRFRRPRVKRVKS